MMSAKVFYNIKGIVRSLLPKVLTQASLQHTIERIFTLNDSTLESIAKRVGYYHQINTPFTILPLSAKTFKPERLSLVSPHFGILKDHTLANKKYPTAYFYDTYEWTRYFPDTYKWYYEFGDVNYYLTHPGFTKTRPIDERVRNELESKSIKQDNSLESGLLDSGNTSLSFPANCTQANNILLQLDKYRHFNFLQDSIPYESKKDILLFRGAAPQEHRVKFLKCYFSHPLCDLGHTGDKAEHPNFYKDKMSRSKHLAYKFLLSLEGNDVASNLKWILGSNSLCIMPKPKYESWFMENTLIPNVHYALLDDDYNNLEALLEFFITHPKDAKDIIHSANLYCAKFHNPRIETAVSLLVFRKYFYLSNQGDLTPKEHDLLGV